jgi:small redox-active disulfide protein 2
MELKVLGMGCAKCSKVESNVKEAVKELGIEATVEKIEDVKEIMSFGVMATPALVIDGKVAFAGKTATTKEIKSMLEIATK